MKAVVLHAPHHLVIEDRPIPIPGEGDVLVRIHRGGICGSDMHYYHHGGFGTVRIKAPMVPGHELSGVVERLGAGVSSIVVGTAVAVNPSLACGTCSFCVKGMSRHCSDMRFMGSAMRTPHIDGGFREYAVVRAAQAVPVGEMAGLEEAACAEPLAVCLHAVSQAPDLRGKRVLVTGFGPIGALTFLAARHAGADAISATDIADMPLEIANKLGAEAVWNVSAADVMEEEFRDRGQFDVVFECSGSPAAMQLAIGVTKPCGTIVQVGLLPDEIKAELNPMITKEITFRGSFRFDSEFDLAVQLISDRTIDVRPIVSRTFPFERADDAFAFARDRQQAIKVMLEFA
ncbi:MULTISPECIES: L-idonate 5-dehydrogenase [Agrobacterium]|uniref:L-idonate 5-dehydrogenase n=1 Tax=Agrobacterium tumefaciens TaxID=358 RepID=UPI000EF1C61B|nr:hypothetical protein At1D1108_50530 [Agrobacterium tumefaciens]NSY09800.1 L-idonate 5-dehydrogenase [Agrobacterium tumefaciens]NSY93343.1 L-idonate 5-dehydrogenase [Agrobacterium tumefaciens]